MNRIFGGAMRGKWMGRVLEVLRQLAWSGVLVALVLLPAAAQRPAPPPEAETGPTPKPSAVQLRKERFNELKKEAERLLRTAEELQKAMDKPGNLPRAVIAEKAGEIEKHAKRIQSKLTGF